MSKSNIKQLYTDFPIQHSSIELCQDRYSLYDKSHRGDVASRQQIPTSQLSQVIRVFLFSSHIMFKQKNVHTCILKPPIITYRFRKLSVKMSKRGAIEPLNICQHCICPLQYRDIVALLASDRQCRQVCSSGWVRYCLLLLFWKFVHTTVIYIRFHLMLFTYFRVFLLMKLN